MTFYIKKYNGLICKKRREEKNTPKYKNIPGLDGANLLHQNKL